MAEIIHKNNPWGTSAHADRDLDQFMQRTNGRTTTESLSPDPNHRQAQAPPSKQQEMERKMKMTVFATAEGRGGARRAGRQLEKKGDGASLTCPDGNGNSESSVGFAGRKTC